MSFHFYMPTEIFHGRGVLRENAAKLLLGRHAFIVTGKRSAKLSGALDAVTELLSANGAAFTVFDEIRENPPIADCHRGGALAAACGADFVIGIGGGSPMDAAKAIAAYAANPDMGLLDIYEPSCHKKKALPLVAIPTTSGTGSEANPYSVLTLEDGVHKKTYNHPDAWFRVAFVDPSFTDSLPYGTTVSTALDAFSHAMESFMSPKANAFSEAAALFAAHEILSVLREKPCDFTAAMRDTLSLAATAGGMAISVTGTGFPHPLGYSITLLDGVPHGYACALFGDAYIRYNQKCEQGAQRIRAFCAALDITPAELGRLLGTLADVQLTFTEEEIKARIDLIANAKNYVNSPYVINRDEMTDIYRELFLKK